MQAFGAAANLFDDTLHVWSILAIRLLHSQGMPAPHWQPPSPSVQALLGWFSHTRPKPWQTVQLTSVIGVQAPERRGCSKRKWPSLWGKRGRELPGR